MAGLKHSNHKLQLSLARAQKGPEKKRSPRVKAEKLVDRADSDDMGCGIADEHPLSTHETIPVSDTATPLKSTSPPDNETSLIADTPNDYTEDTNETLGSVKVPGAWPHSKVHSSPLSDTRKIQKAPETPAKVPKVYTYFLGAHDTESAFEIWELVGQETVLEFLASVRLRHDMKPHRSFRSVEVDIDGSRTKVSFLAPDAATMWAKLVESIAYRAEAGVEGAVDILLRAG